VAAAAVVVVLLLAGACGDDGDDESSSADQQAGGEATADQAETAPAPQLATQERKVIRTANLLVEVDDVSDATDEAVQINADAGGMLFTRDSDLEGEQQSDLTLKTPPDQLDAVLDDLADLGDPLEREESAQDVTDQVVDLEGRLASAQTSAERLRGLLSEAANTTDLVTIEAELAKRESEIESMEGQLRVLNSQVELATINLTLTEDTSDVDFPSFFGALGAGIGVLVLIIRVALIVVVFSLPFLVVGGLIWWFAGRKAWDRYRSSRRSAPPH
jgi:hypothetical protein